MVGKKQVGKLDKKKVSKKINSPLSTEDRIQVFANIIVERILEDNLQGSLQCRKSEGL